MMMMMVVVILWYVIVMVVVCDSGGDDGDEGEEIELEKDGEARGIAEGTSLSSIQWPSAHPATVPWSWIRGL